jgi:hypothetical protein
MRLKVKGIEIGTVMLSPDGKRWWNGADWVDAHGKVVSEMPSYKTELFAHVAGNYVAIADVNNYGELSGNCWGLHGDEVPESVRLEHYCSRFVNTRASKCHSCPNAAKVQILEDRKSKEAAERFERLERLEKQPEPLPPAPIALRDSDLFEERNADGLFTIHRRPAVPFVHRYVLQPIRKLERKVRPGWNPYDDGADRRDGWD